MCFPPLSCSHMQTHSLTHTYTLSADGGERGHSISRQVLEEKRERKGREKKGSLAVPFPLTQRQAWPKHTGTLSSLLAIHIILSLCPLCEDTNFTTGPSSQPICEKIVVEREGRDTWHRLGLKASLNGGIPPPFFFFSPLWNERQSCNYPPFFSICCSLNVFGGFILGWKRPAFPPFFQFNFKNQFLPIIAFKSQAIGASPWAVCHDPPSSTLQSPPIRLLYYLADVYQRQKIISKLKALNKSCSCPRNRLARPCPGQAGPRCRIGGGKGGVHEARATPRNHLHFTHSSNPLTRLLLHHCGEGGGCISEKPGCLSVHPPPPFHFC